MKNITDLFKILIPSKNINYQTLKEEQKICVEVANLLRKLTLEDKFPYIWFHVPNEFSKYNAVYGLKMGWMGRISGVADFCFMGEKHCFFLEIKSQKGKQSSSQKIFEEWCDSKKVSYCLAHSLEEAIHIINSFLEGR